MVAPHTLASSVQAAQPGPTPAAAFYRSVSLKVIINIGAHPLDGAHAGASGGRYHRAGGAPICYLAGTQTLATFECEHEAMVLHLPSKPLDPRITFAVTVDNARILDLTNPLVLAVLGVAPGDLVLPSAHWQQLNRQGVLSTTQEIGETARARPEIDGLLVPSWLGSFLNNAIPRSDNLVLFMNPAAPEQPRRPGVTMTIHDPTNLLPP
ncbi:MAG: RES family NAD+ phosphorylase [Polyangiaceae bacterium]